MVFRCGGPSCVDLHRFSLQVGVAWEGCWKLGALGVKDLSIVVSSKNLGWR